MLVPSLLLREWPSFQQRLLYTLTTLSKSSEVFADHLGKWISSLRFFKSPACAFSLIKFLCKMKKNLRERASLHCPNFTKTSLIMRNRDNGFFNHLKEALLGLLAVMKWLCFEGQRCLQKSSSWAKEIAMTAKRMSFLLSWKHDLKKYG